MERNNIFEMESGNYYYIERRENTLVAGSACNWGIIPAVTIEYDEDISEDANLYNLYDAVKEYDDGISLMTCPICDKAVYRNDMWLTHDCHGIQFRYVCEDCYNKIMEEKGYDGEYYTEADECLEEDY